MAHRLVGHLATFYPLAMFAACWELAAQYGMVAPIFLPTFSHVVIGLWHGLLDGDYVELAGASLYRALAGFLIAMIVGVPLGFATAQSKLFDMFVEPIVATGFPAPKIAFLPIFVLWFGVDHLSKILLVALVCVFPFIVAAHASASMVSRPQVWAARAMATTRFEMFYRIILPASLPSLMSGLRVAIPHALVTTFAAEMIAGGGGLGSELVYAQRFFQTARVFEILLVMLAIGYVMDVMLLRLRATLLRWHEQAAFSD